jgi:hypothetical protein
MFNNKSPTARARRQSNRNDDAVFIGWQPTRFGVVYALYNITAADHPLNGSTVTENCLLKLNLQIPQTPPRPATTH